MMYLYVRGVGGMPTALTIFPPPGPSPRRPRGARRQKNALQRAEAPSQARAPGHVAQSMACGWVAQADFVSLAQNVTQAPTGAGTPVPGAHWPPHGHVARGALALINGLWPKLLRWTRTA